MIVARPLVLGAIASLVVAAPLAAASRAPAAESTDYAIVFNGNAKVILSIKPDGRLEFEPGVTHERAAMEAMRVACRTLPPLYSPPGGMIIGAAVFVGEDGEVTFGPAFAGTDQDRADWILIGRAYASRCTI